VAMSAGVAAIGDAPFTDAGRLVAGFAGVVLLHTLLAAGIGATAGLTPPGVVAYLTAPTAVGFAAGQLSGEALRWIDLFGVYKRFRSDQPFQELDVTLTAVVLWIVVPLAVGIVLSLRREVA
jgi:ABC-2 type transport system permease protein